MRLYQERVADILTNAERYHSAYYQAETFRGPSLYFHQRALETRESADFSLHIEYVYATLASWGMHRMGKRGSEKYLREVRPALVVEPDDGSLLLTKDGTTLIAGSGLILWT
ncbi:MAG: hypothetical protein M3410_08150 [Acidobacteriota bacterium]|nr:hypothetical protein [Acidobacteriota bacterium]